MLNIIYEDPNIIILNKPQHLPVETDHAEAASLAGLVRRQYGEAFACHRLDAMTGGLCMIAKNSAACDEAIAMFRQGTADNVRDDNADDALHTKIYLCETTTKPHPERGELAAYIMKERDHSTVRVFDHRVAGSKLARTLYKVVQCGGADSSTCLVSARLLTGRTHQIRAQFAAAGWPILGDDKYGDWTINKSYRIKTLRLWAVGLAFGNTSGCLAGLSGKVFWVNAPFAPSFDTSYIGQIF